MAQAHLLTGRPGVGKTTCLLRVLERLPLRAVGFYTREMRGPRGRVGFELLTLDGGAAVLAHVEYPGPPHVGRYGVDIEALERVGVPAIAAAGAGADLVVVDEIGKMELASERFRSAVLAALEGQVPLLGTILLAPHPWADRLKADPRVLLVPVTVETRDRVVDELVATLPPRRDSPPPGAGALARLSRAPAPPDPRGTPRSGRLDKDFPRVLSMMTIASPLSSAAGAKVGLRSPGGTPWRR